jgi:hypothetical protein
LQKSLSVTWRVTPLQPPLVRRHCSRCSGDMPFACSMKFRTNAQKKRIDVWLIYRCRACDAVWNLPILERMSVGEIAPEVFDAVARNDSALALRHAFDRTRLLCHGAIEERPDVSIRKSQEVGCALKADAITIALALALPCGFRLDRLLTKRGSVSAARSSAGCTTPAHYACHPPSARHCAARLRMAKPSRSISRNSMLRSPKLCAAARWHDQLAGSNRRMRPSSSSVSR